MKTTRLRFYFLITIALQFILFTATAQTCPGEVVQFRETFGQGNNSASLPNGRTNYNYNGNNALNDGDYRLNKNSQARPEWHSSSDHTGNNNGRMMIINASYTAGEFYRDTVNSLVPSNFYSVYLYVMNLNTQSTCGGSAILPNLSFVIEAYYPLTGRFSTITTFTSGNIARSSSPTWVLTGGFFTVPAGVTSVRYRIINNSTGGCGNDLAIDDITFAQCSAATLPVKGLNLSADLRNGTSYLEWSTLQEIETDRFFIEKSADGKEWETVGTVAAAGNSQVKKNYHFEDLHPFAEQTYYRIKELDQNGNLNYSYIVWVKSSVRNNASLSASPNPFNNQVTLQVAATEDKLVAVRITDMNGKVVYNRSTSLHKGNNSIQLSSWQGLTAGIYQAVIVQNDGVVLGVSKLVKL